MADDNIDNSQTAGANISNRVWNINNPLPWFGVAMLMAAISLACGVYAIAVVNQAQRDAWNAQTQSLLLRDYVDHLRIEMAQHGIKPPEYPVELKR